MVKRVALLAAAALAGFVQLFGQTDSAGVMVLSEGLEFHVASLPPHLGPGETAPDNSLVLVLTSRAGAVVRIGDPLGVAIHVPAGEVRFWRIPHLETSVHVRGDRPFHVSTVQDLRGSGEQAWHLPLYSWGTRYRPFQWWQDSYGVEGQPETTTVARMVLLAGPKATTVEVDRAGTVDRYELEPYETITLDEEVRQGASRDVASDPTGRQVRSTQPIAVISGHTKAGVLRYPIGLPSTGEYARPANRSRGNLHDAMLPEAYADSEFVTVPLRYTPTRIRGWALEEQGIEDDRGDVIRFVAVEDGTEIHSQGPGVAPHLDTVLNAGGAWYAPRVEQPRRWWATKPVLCVQYGKSYGRITSQADRPDLDPTVDAGMPMLLTVPSVEQWGSGSTVVAHENTDNFLNVACRTADVQSLRLDGQPIQLPLTSIQIPQSPYTVITGPLPAGTHHIAAIDPDVRFAAWSYGSEDGLQLGRIYGSAVGMDLAIDCEDSIVIDAFTADQSVSFRYRAIDLEGTCAQIAMAFVEQCRGGMIATADGEITITRATPTTMVDGNILVATRSGRFERRWFHLDGTTSMDEERAAPFTVYPQPAREELFIRFTSEPPIGEPVRLYSMTGTLVRSIEFRDSVSVRIDVSGLPPGVYGLCAGDLRQRVVIAP